MAFKIDMLEQLRCGCFVTKLVFRRYEFILFRNNRRLLLISVLFALFQNVLTGLSMEAQVDKECTIQNRSQEILCPSTLILSNKLAL